ncbi:hypothetical protein [Methylobacterium organophilum]|uniref:Uncharacterized protein n=1 Tax=Methylobacterium organophilum TaxID=410 RepID=A0ABQ4TB03_METOR|nr:hypothetical protein [Methylobacterium organophilum]GJE27752.1 hypothetical protein LKMONMHP_2613 [Methylobacterium organophilum]
MGKWVPAVASIGLLCLLIIPAPGVLGLLIGTACALAIIISAVMWFLDRMATRLLVWGASFKRKVAGKRRRDVHAGSGISKKTTRRVA